MASPDGIGPYLGFLAALASAQQVAQDLPEPETPDIETISRSLEYRMPPLDRSAFRPDTAFRSLSDRLFGELEAIDKPPAARTALAAVREADHDDFARMVANLMADSVAVEAMAEHAYVAAALQLHFVRAASVLPERRSKPVGDGACPGLWRAAGIFGDRRMAAGRRSALLFLRALRNALAPCSHQMRALLVDKRHPLSGDRRWPRFDQGGNLRQCGCYVKILNQQKDVWLEPLADDVGSLGIDLLMRETQFRRGAFNPFLLGY